jgi:hypothetical protein
MHADQLLLLLLLLLLPPGQDVQLRNRPVWAHL